MSFLNYSKMKVCVVVCLHVYVYLYIWVYLYIYVYVYVYVSIIGVPPPLLPPSRPCINRPFTPSLSPPFSLSPPLLPKTFHLSCIKHSTPTDSLLTPHPLRPTPTNRNRRHARLHKRSSQRPPHIHPRKLLQQTQKHPKRQKRQKHSKQQTQQKRQERERSRRRRRGMDWVYE